MNECREVFARTLTQTELLKCDNASLMQAFLYQDDAQKDSFNNGVIDAANRITKKGSLYDIAFKRRNMFLKNVGLFKNFKVIDRLVVGIANSSPTEVGLTFNQIYGVPIIPGSALKGLAAHYCSDVWGNRDATFKKDIGSAYNIIFGDNDEAGFIRFLDAWIIPSAAACIKKDIMTTHHQEYYGKKGAVPPSDMDSPVPIAFLSVDGCFQICISCEDPRMTVAAAWQKLVMQLLEDALKSYGIGAKTSSGYGRMEPCN